MTNKTLKYLFTATFADGSVIEQTPEDVSAIDPEKRSQFYDVMQRSEETPLAAFVLSGNGHQYGVDLTDGHFEIDGMPFRMHDEDLSDFRVVFFRRHKHSFNVGVTKDLEEISHDVVYRIGWQCTVDGKNYQQVMQVE